MTVFWIIGVVLALIGGFILGVASVHSKYNIGAVKRVLKEMKKVDDKIDEDFNQ